ncbi:hypothetical protein A2U01_0030672, partial [Trifolium medium]|nr:hypothetical protein [Trifolium medium]
VHIVVEIRIGHLFQITQVLEGKELVKGIKSARSSIITGPIEKTEKTIGPGSLASLVATGMDVMVCSALLIGIMNLVVSSGELKTSGNSDCG